MELMEPLPPEKNGVYWVQISLPTSLFVDSLLFSFFFLRINLNNLENSNPVLCSKQFLFQTQYAEKQPPRKLRELKN